MKPIVSIAELIPLCGGCPSDWEARDHLGREVYIRFRWGRLSVTVTEDDRFETILSLKHGHPMDGVMSIEEMVPLTKEVIDWVEHRIHFPSP